MWPSGKNFVLHLCILFIIVIIIGFIAGYCFGEFVLPSLSNETSETFNSSNENDYVGSVGTLSITQIEERVYNWERVGSPMKASANNSIFKALSGNSESISVSADITPSVSSNLWNLIQFELTANFSVSSEAEEITLNGYEREIQKNETIEFYYAPIYMVFKVHVPIKIYEKDTSNTYIGTLENEYEYLQPTGGYQWAHIITDSNGNVIEDTRK